MMIKIGEKVPDFKLESTLDYNLSLSELSGKKIVLYFYPKDNTPG
jgi:peroxiredoxin Q/BCP